MTTSTAITPAPSITNDADPVVAAYEKDTSTIEKLKSVQVALAVEYGKLRWLEENPSEVADLLETGRAISRRVRALKRLVEIELREHRLEGGPQEVDLHSPLVKEVVALLVTTLLDTTTDIIGADDAERIVEMFQGAIEADDDIPWP